MEKLDKVIAGLTGCIACICSNCEYFDPSNEAACTERLTQDALDAIERLREENQDLRKDVETLHRINEDWRVEVARLYKRIDEARAAGMRLNGVAELPGTNYQKITKKSPLQMAWWLWNLNTVCDCCDLHGCCGIPEDEVTEEYCLEHILLWLGQEAE